jgi:DNA-binding MarR family transcriptional regulator
MGDQELDLALAVRELVRSVDAFRNERAAAIGPVSVTDIAALGHLYVDGSHTPTDLARRLRVTTASVTELLDRLEQRGWISREPHPHDRRRILVTLTDAGHGLTCDTYRQFATRLAPVYDILTSDQRKTVMGFLRAAATQLADAD